MSLSKSRDKISFSMSTALGYGRKSIIKQNIKAFCLNKLDKHKQITVLCNGNDWLKDTRSAFCLSDVEEVDKAIRKVKRSLIKLISDSRFY